MTCSWLDDADGGPESNRSGDEYYAVELKAVVDEAQKFKSDNEGLQLFIEQRRAYVRQMQAVSDPLEYRLLQGAELVTSSMGPLSVSGIMSESSRKLPMRIR